MSVARVTVSVRTQATFSSNRHGQKFRFLKTYEQNKNKQTKKGNLPE